jgi:hypothetical protein
LKEFEIRFSCLYLKVPRRQISPISNKNDLRKKKNSSSRKEKNPQKEKGKEEKKKEKKERNKIHKNEECISVFRLVQSKRNAFEEKKRKRKNTAFPEILL